MKRGEIWTVAGAGLCMSKPRPAVILQDDRFDGVDSVTIRAFTTDEHNAPLFRVDVEPGAMNGLDAVSQRMVDKITTVPRLRLGNRIGWRPPL
jgi:mRNA interferase MazF